MNWIINKYNRKRLGVKHNYTITNKYNKYIKCPKYKYFFPLNVQHSAPPPVLYFLYSTYGGSGGSRVVQFACFLPLPATPSSPHPAESRFAHCCTPGQRTRPRTEQAQDVPTE